jgi:hypothetical protein
MTHDVEPIDEATLAQLVHDVADDWRLPPQRLNAPTWRDRVDPGRRRGGLLGHGWLARLSGAGALAIGLTVGLSLVAVWITMPNGRPGLAGTSPTASGSQAATGSQAAPSRAATPEGTAPSAPSPLPKLTLNGALPDPTSVLVRSGPGFAIADLTTGTLGTPLDGATGSSEVRRLADGRYVCLCVTTDAFQGAWPSHAVVELRTYDAAGTPTGTTPVGEYSGGPHPRPIILGEEPQDIDVAISYSPDGRLGYVGWSTRQPPVWRSGIVVLDLATQGVVRRLELPDTSIGPDDAPVNVLAPRVAVGPEAKDALISRQRYTVEGLPQTYLNGTDHFLVPASFPATTAARPFAGGQSCPDGQADAGLTDGGNGWFVCWSSTGGLMTVRRVSPAGDLLGDTQVNSMGEGGSWTVSGSSIYFWRPVSRTVDRVDLVSGAMTSGSAPAPTAVGGSGSSPLEALGRWLAPSTTAKILLQPGIVVSPGPEPMLYAIGIGSGDATGAGSTGVFVFDSRTLQPLAHWSPVADFVSLAMSPDGKFVYAAGAPGVDADGRRTSNAASITVYDAGDGSVRLVAGELSNDDVLFNSPYVP